MAWHSNTRKLDRIIADLQQQVMGLNNNSPTHRRKGGGKGNGGGGGKGAGKARPKPTSESCKCCGKVGHLKKECRFREKACNTCGKTGHLAAICRDNDHATTNTTKTTTTSPEPKTIADASKHAIVINTDPPWVCSVCYAVVADQKLTKCPKPNCHAKRLMPEKTEAPPKNLITKEALKVIDGDGGKIDEEKRKAEIEQWEKTRDDAKEKGWAIILEHAEKRLEE